MLIRIIFGFLLISVFLLTGSCSTVHKCLELQNKSVEIDGEILPDSKVYQCSNDRVVVWLVDNQVTTGIFIVDSSSNRVGFLNESDFEIGASELIYKNNFPKPHFPEDETEVKPNERKLIITSDYISFLMGDQSFRIFEKDKF